MLILRGVSFSNISSHGTDSKGRGRQAFANTHSNKRRETKTEMERDWVDHTRAEAYILVEG